MSADERAKKFLNDWFNSCDETHWQLAVEALAVSITEARLAERARIVAALDEVYRYYGGHRGEYSMALYAYLYRVKEELGLVAPDEPAALEGEDL